MRVASTTTNVCACLSVLYCSLPWGEQLFGSRGATIVELYLRLWSPLPPPPQPRSEVIAATLACSECTTQADYSRAYLTSAWVFQVIVFNHTTNNGTHLHTILTQITEIIDKYDLVNQLSWSAIKNTVHGA